VIPPLDEDVVQRVDDLGTGTWSGTVYRHATAGRDPLSGAGARLNGGRWNPRDLCSTIYLAQPLRACLAELDRLAEAAGVSTSNLLRAPRSLHTISVRDVSLLDLRGEDALQYVGLSLDDIRDDDRTACQTVGNAAFFLEMARVVAPSATGEGLVIALFETRLTAGQLRVVDTVELTESTYTDGLR
jgi:RES domain-containing protein